MSIKHWEIQDYYRWKCANLSAYCRRGFTRFPGLCCQSGIYICIFPSMPIYLRISKRICLVSSKGNLYGVETHHHRLKLLQTLSLSLSTKVVGIYNIQKLDLTNFFERRFVKVQEWFLLAFLTWKNWYRGTNKIFTARPGLSVEYPRCTF